MKQLIFAAALVATAGPFPLIAAPAPASIASFDCRRAVSRAEHLICGDVVLGTYDRGVQAAYRTVIGWRADPAALTAQRAWLRERDGCADTICLRRAYEGRLETLFESVPQRLALRRADRTGTLTMLPLGGGGGDFAFHLSAFHQQNPTPGAVNTGEATGVVRTRGGRGTYRGETCSIAFRAVPGRGWLVQTSDDNACGAGLNVQMSGRFMR